MIGRNPPANRRARQAGGKGIPRWQLPVHCCVSSSAAKDTITGHWVAVGTEPHSAMATDTYPKAEGRGGEGKGRERERIGILLLCSKQKHYMQIQNDINC